MKLIKAPDMLFIFYQNYSRAGAATMDKTGEYRYLSGQSRPSRPVGRNEVRATIPCRKI